MKKTFLIIISIFIFFTGCATLEPITFQPNEAKHVNKIVILGPKQSNEISVNVTGDANIFYLMMGPAIIPQIMMAFATHQANKDEAIYLNDLIFDFNIEEILREKFNHELKANTSFNPVLQNELYNYSEIKEILDKYERTHTDYIKISNLTGADTIIELSVFSYGIKDPGITWDPNVNLTADARMIRVKDNKVLWQIRMTENTKRKPTGLDYRYYRENNAELLRFELEAAAEIVAKALVQNLGFEIKDGIGDIRDIVTQKVAKALEDYKDLYTDIYQNNSNNNNMRQLRFAP